MDQSTAITLQTIQQLATSIAQTAGLALGNTPAQQGGLPSGQVAPYQTTPVIAPKIKYPDYILPKSDAYTEGGTPIPTNQLATEQDAYALAIELSMKLGLVVTLIPVDDKNSYGSDREMRFLNVPGVSTPASVGLEWWSKNRAGVGAPGKWTIMNGTLAWTLDDADADPWQPGAKVNAS